MANRIKVLIVDDSALIRTLLTRALSESDELEVVGAAEDPYIAGEMIKQFKPDVLTLDIEMPRMDGLTFLKNIMRLSPLPVVMVSALTKKGAAASLKSLEYGAIDFVAKPDADVKENLLAYSNLLIEKVIAASKVNVASFVSASSIAKSTQVDTTLKKISTSIEVITIGASTGGTEAIKAVVMDLPTNLPPIVMAQHIPPVFSTSFAKRLNESSAITVIEPTETMELKAGHAYLAPGDEHLLIYRSSGRLYLKIEQTETVNRHRPSVEVLFNSVKNACGNKSLAVILTGMGADGAQGLKNLKDEGVHTIAQDEASSVVWGMPGAAVKLGAATEILPLVRIATRLVSLVNEK